MLVAIHQPNLLPSLSLFAKWAMADALILLDGVQYVRHGHQDHYLNRCLLARGWATVPVLRGPPAQLIRQVRAAPDWQPQRLYERILGDYAGAPHRRWTAEVVLEAMEDHRRGPLWRAINLPCLSEVGELLGIKAPLYTQQDLGIEDADRDRRLVRLVRAVGGDRYLSGGKGPVYMRPEVWLGEGMPVAVSRFHWPPYPRGGTPWQIGLSVVDALAWLGPDGVARLMRDSEVEEWDLRRAPAQQPA